jgi:hypothetical protein
MESRSDRICSNETLGMEPGNYGPACPNSGIILVPPVLNAQMEIIVTATILQPMKKEVLQRLKDLIQENQRRSWFTIYLCMFILLHSCALLTAGDEKKAQKQGLVVQSSRFTLLGRILIMRSIASSGNHWLRDFTMEPKSFLRTFIIVIKGVALS